MKKVLICAAVLLLVVGVAAGSFILGKRMGEGRGAQPTKMTEELEVPETRRRQESPEADDAAEESPDGAEAETDSYIDQVIALVNEERAKAGAAPLKRSDPLCAAAAVRAEEAAASFSHTRPDGSEFWTVLDQNDITYQSCGENIAFGQQTPEEVVTDWMNSEGHRANILNEGYGSIGVGYCEDSSGQGYWVQLFMLER